MLRDDRVPLVAIDLEERGKRKRGPPKKTSKKQVEKTEKVGIKTEFVRSRAKWRDGARKIAEWSQFSQLR